MSTQVYPWSFIIETSLSSSRAVAQDSGRLLLGEGEGTSASAVVAVSDLGVCLAADSSVCLVVLLRRVRVTSGVKLLRALRRRRLGLGVDCAWLDMVPWWMGWVLTSVVAGSSIAGMTSACLVLEEKAAVEAD